MANKNCQSVIECNPKVYGSNFFFTNSCFTYYFMILSVKSWQSGIHVVFNASENCKTDSGGLNFVDPEK